MSPRARNGANNRRELGVSSDTMGRAVLLALVSEERTLFRGGRVDSSSSTSTVIVAIVPDIRDSKYFLFSYVGYIIRPVSTVPWTTTKQWIHYTQGYWRPPFLLLFLLWVSIVMGFLHIAYLATTSVVIYLFRRRSQSRANSVVFVGTPDAGKTAILSTVRGLSTYSDS